MPEKNNTAPKLSILIPARNEGRNIGIIIKILTALLEVSHEIIVIHDTLADDTVPAVRELQARFPRVKLVHNNLGAGVINALKCGIDAAAGDNVLIFAADEAGPVLAIEQMLDLVQRGCDFVSCTRYAHGGKRVGGALSGRVLSWGANKIFRMLTGSVFTDNTTGIKMFRKEIFRGINLESRPVGWAVVFELSIKVQLSDAVLGEVPIISIDRFYGGRSTYALKPWAKEYLRWFLWGVPRLRRKRPKNRIIVSSRRI